MTTAGEWRDFRNVSKQNLHNLLMGQGREREEGNEGEDMGSRGTREKRESTMCSSLGYWLLRQHNLPTLGTRKEDSV